MTPSERERWTQAMIDSLAQHVGEGFWEDGWGGRRVAEMLDAADEAVPMVSEAQYLRLYPDLLERAERAEAAARKLWTALDDLVAVARPVLEPPGRFVSPTMQQARDTLARYPSSSGEEGTEG